MCCLCRLWKTAGNQMLQYKEGRREGSEEGRKTPQTSTEREREEPWGEGRQEKAGSTAPDGRGWRSGEVGDDSTFGIPYIWLNWPTVTYSFTQATHKHGDKREERDSSEDKQQEGKHRVSDLLHHKGVREGGSERKQFTDSTLGFDWLVKPRLASYQILHRH